MYFVTPPSKEYINTKLKDLEINKYGKSVSGTSHIKFYRTHSKI